MASCFQCDGKKSKSWFTDFKYNPRKDQAGDVRNILLIIATLIAAVTFQSGVNPPGGVWQDYTIRNRTLCAEKRAQGIWSDPSCYKSHRPGTAIYASRKTEFSFFLAFNTVALSTSVLVIVFLTCKFPFHLEVLIATASMLATYASAIFAVTPGNSYRFRYLLMAAAFPFVLRALIYMVTFKAYQEGEDLCDKCRRGNSQNTRSWRNWFKYFQYEEDWDPPTKVRNVLLVVATLIAAVIFQAAGVKPPSGVWQANDHGHRGGRAIYASEK